MPTRRGGDNPSKVLVIFLVFFIILSIGLGAGTYFGFAGQKDYFDSAAKEKKVAKELEEKRDIANYRAREALVMVGGSPALESAGDEPGRWAADREEFVKDGGKFGTVENKAKLLEMLKTAEKDLGFDSSSKKYGDNYIAKVAKLNAKVAELEAKNKQLLDEKKAVEDSFNTLRVSFKGDFDKLKKDITAGHAKALEANKLQSAETLKLVGDFEAKSKELIDKNDAWDKEKRVLEAMITKLKEQKGMIAAAPGAEDKGPARPPAELHALALDVSKGTTLWDKARGKIARMDATARRPYLNIGSAQGVTPGLTFNVFAAAPDGTAKGTLKGTVEVISVGTNTSQAQITSLYDAEGKEIPLSDAGRNQLFRETSNPLREGDLLFNLAWKEHVAIAGPVGLSPGNEESPAEQMRDLQRYMHALERRGVVVDAYVNLLDGKVVGAVTPETGFLVQGYLPTTKAERDGKDDWAKAVRTGMEELKKQALEVGTFVISPENLAVVMGARQLRANLRTEAAQSFSPRLPEGRAPAPQNVVAPQAGEAPKGGINP
jgi:hypothetical protein